MMMKKLEISLLPFHNLVLYPTAALPLYIFDPAYIQMIDDSIKYKRPIGLCMSDESTSLDNFQIKNILTPRAICGIGEPIVLQEFEDGSKYVLIQGFARAEIGQKVQELPYTICEAHIIEDTSKEANILGNSSLENLKKILHIWLKTNIQDQERREMFIKRINSAEHIVDYVSTFLIHDREIKQMLLETYNLGERVKALEVLLSPFQPYAGENTIVANRFKEFENIEKTGSEN